MQIAPARSELTLRPVTEGDRFRLRRWLSEPHVIRWWGSKSAAEAAVALAQNSSSALVRIIYKGDEPIGYAQAMDMDDRRLPPATWQADAFIGSMTHRGRGLGALALSQLRDEVFQTTLAAALAVRIPVRNERQVRAIERAGFRWRSVTSDPLLGPCWLLVAER